ncbi:MAG TPA: transcriptional regulator [Candidatus Nitrosotenuis sp.]|nr:transcriptional regulator [Candidatus Nitrosotenuis sp.]
MPEIWLNYGITDIVLDIKAENLDQKIEFDAKTLDDVAISERLGSIDLTKPLTLVVLNYTVAVKKTLDTIFAKCTEKSLPRPKIFADKNIMNVIKATLPPESQVFAFEGIENVAPNLVFVGEMEFDGLFGFDTIATKLLRRFGKDQLLSAYEKRQGNLPNPGIQTQSLDVAKNFANSFEISAIEIVAGHKGIVDLSVGHPSNTLSVSQTMASFTKTIEKHRTLLISTGKDSSNDTLAKSLGSLWNCYTAIKDEGLALLLGECKAGIGSEAIRQYIEGRLSIERLQKPAKYVEGMEDLLYLTEVQKKMQIGIVSVLPEFYIKKLNMKLFDGVKETLEYVLKHQGARQKISIVPDGARILLRPN